MSTRRSGTRGKVASNRRIARKRRSFCGFDHGQPTVGRGRAHRRREAEWEAYVRAFVRRYQLDEGQTQRAYTILRDCQERANQYLRRRTDDFERLHREARELLDAASALNGTPTGGDRVRQRAVRMDIRRQHVRLMKPIVDIFDRDLKPRLEKLPTRAQRRAAGEDSPADTAPADGG